MAIDVSKQVAKAEAAAAKRRYDVAIEIYIQALEIDPDNRRARKGVRLAALKKHEHSYPSKMSIKLSTSGARLGMMQPNADRKLSACEAYLKVDPKNVNVAYTLADTAEKAGYHDAAIGCLEAMIEYAPKEEKAYVSLGRLLSSKEPDQAIEYLEKALALNPRNQEAIKLRKDTAAELSIKKTGFETARTTHDMLRNKSDTYGRLNADRMQRTEDQNLDYIGRLEQQVQSNPDDRELRNKLARAYASGGRFNDAAKTYKEMIDRNDGDYDAKVQLGDLRLNQIKRRIAAAKQKGDDAQVKQFEEQLAKVKVQEFKIRVAEHPTDLALRYTLGQALLELGDVDGAIAQFQKSIADPRKRFDSLRLLGDCFMQKGLYDLAAMQLEQALDESPGLNSESGKAVVYSLGLLRERQGDLAAARDQFTKIYMVDISFEDVGQKVTEISQKLAEQN